MLRLEDLKPGVLVSGLEPQGICHVLHVEWHGDSAVDATWKNAAGETGSRLIFRDEEDGLNLEENSLPWTFTADGGRLKLASEAWRIHYAHLFDPYLAVYASNVEPLPHQISAVYQEMLPRLPLRFVLADDPGAGKTIMTGLLVRELIARGNLTRCLIVCPGSLEAQWQEELYNKFSLRFEILSRERLDSALSGNAFAEAGLALIRLDKLARDDTLMAKLRETEWDLIVCDEAHKMSASLYGGEVKPTRRFQLGRLLSGIARNFLLLTATPHNGKEEEFQLFLSLVDSERFGGIAKTGAKAGDVSDVMRRLVKEELLKFDGSSLFPERQAITLNYDLSKEEAELYEAVTGYVRSEFNRADTRGGKQRATVGFALTVLQRRLASSPEAIYQSLRRRRERLEKRLEEASQKAAPGLLQLLPFNDSDFDEDDLSSEELENLEETLADSASAAATRAELEAEIATLHILEDLAGKVRQSGRDRKWEELSATLQDEALMFDEKGARNKLIIFTEHRDTLRYLESRLTTLLGNPAAIVTIYGGLSRNERHRAEDLFRQDAETRILIATDAAGEGVNLQRSNLMINYDLPWNPNRLEQRFGRIHRIGQSHKCWLWNLVASQTREGAVFQRLFAKLEQERHALGGKVFDVLGKLSFNNRPLRELLIEAVRESGPLELNIQRQIDSALDTSAIKELLAEHCLTAEIMDAGLVSAMREEMERLEARRLQPHFIFSFFQKAFRALGGQISPRETGRFEITRVPASLRSLPGLKTSPLPRYERVCFDKSYRDGNVKADLICPGHPLLDAVIAAVSDADLLREGAILIDEKDYGSDMRLLFYIESALQDGTLLPNGKRREISRQIHFVKLDETGFVSCAGHAPYLDYRVPDAEEKAALLAYSRNLAWLGPEVEKKALDFAVQTLAPAHLQEVRSRALARIKKTQREVISHLDREIQYWDARAIELAAQEAAGKRNSRLNSAQCQKRADSLEERKKKRLVELDREKLIAAQTPQISGGCLIAPAGLVNRLMNRPAPFSADVQSRKAVEEAAMAAVIAIEKKLGYQPKDVSPKNLGYDIESAIPEAMRAEAGHALRFIEVKGRARGADNVIVTHNEILAACNAPEQFILAVVEVDGEKTQVTYLKKPFKHLPETALEAGVYNLAALIQCAEKIPMPD